jgi:hypothetical protein
MRWFRRAPPEEPEAAPARPSIWPDEAAWPFTADSPVVAEVMRRGRSVEVMLVDLSGLDWPAIEPLIPTAREVAESQGMVPVLIVDLVDLAGIRATRVAYDCLPNAAANAPLAPDMDWPGYVGRCRRLLGEKWRPRAVVHLGVHAEW